MSDSIVHDSNESKIPIEITDFPEAGAAAKFRALLEKFQVSQLGRRNEGTKIIKQGQSGFYEMEPCQYIKEILDDKNKDGPLGVPEYKFDGCPESKPAPLSDHNRT